MWLFLFTELILFGGIFLLYAVYRTTFPEDFHYGATTLNTLIGGVNTLILLTSSLTMVLSIAHLDRNNRRASSILLALTIGLGLTFLVIKGFEWNAKIGHGLFPGSEELVEHTAGENIFYGLYFGMTGLHALHVIVGLGVLGVMLYRIGRRPRRRFQLPSPGPARLQLTSDSGQRLWQGQSDEMVENVTVILTYGEEPELLEAEAVRLENSGLFWHLVDVIWVFLFPLLYLIT